MSDTESQLAKIVEEEIEALGLRPPGVRSPVLLVRKDREAPPNVYDFRVDIGERQPREFTASVESIATFRESIREAVTAPLTD